MHGSANGGAVAAGEGCAEVRGRHEGAGAALWGIGWGCRVLAGPCVPLGFADASYASGMLDRKSISGCV